MSIDNRIGAVIVTYNSEEWIRNCYDSLMSGSLHPDIIVFVDNNSNDDTVKCLRQLDDIIVMQLSSNVGFGAANNIGAKYCINKGCKWLLLLNPDARVSKDSIQIALETIIKSNTIGIVGGLELDYATDLNSRYTNMHSYSAINSEKIFLVNGKEGQCINGAFLFVRVSTIKQIGLFDPIYHLYFEESDLFRRYRLAGKSILLNPNIKYHHYISASFGNVLPSSKYMSLNKIKSITLSESIHRLTNPERNIIVNVLSLFKQILFIVWNYKANIKLMMTALFVVTKLPICKCIEKWKRDRSRNYKYYMAVLFD